MKHGAAREEDSSSKHMAQQYTMASTRVGAIFERDGEMQGGSRRRKWRPDGRTPTPKHYRHVFDLK
jgi:hypothetical protein